MYADDTTLYCSIDKLATNDINIVINEHLGNGLKLGKKIHVIS